MVTPLITTIPSQPTQGQDAAHCQVSLQIARPERDRRALSWKPDSLFENTYLQKVIYTPSLFIIFLHPTRFCKSLINV
jgi:hypothetical protein